MSTSQSLDASVSACVRLSSFCQQITFLTDVQAVSRHVKPCSHVCHDYTVRRTRSYELRLRVLYKDLPVRQRVNTKGRVYSYEDVLCNSRTCDHYLTLDRVAYKVRRLCFILDIFQTCNSLFMVSVK